MPLLSFNPAGLEKAVDFILIIGFDLMRLTETWPRGRLAAAVPMTGFSVPPARCESWWGRRRRAPPFLLARLIWIHAYVGFFVLLMACFIIREIPYHSISTSFKFSVRKVSIIVPIRSSNPQ